MTTSRPSIRQGIYDLLAAVEIDTKEQGRSHVEPWPSQRIVIDAVAKGLEEGVHEFCILKCRQVAATTVASVIELFWSLANPGTQGCIVADRTDNLERLRRIFASLLETLPPEWRGAEHRIVQNNRNGMAFGNRSVIDLLAAANNPDLGASRALNLLHATECGTWKSLAGVESLKASLARQNPNRLYIWESIANGLNWWYDYCMRAKEDPHMKFIFLGFWSNPTYSIPRSDPDYRQFWDGHLNDDEVQRARYVKQNYNWVIQPEQIAWWRREAEYTEPEFMFRHYPWTEKEAFVSSGSGFFPASRTLEISEALATPPPYKGYRYILEQSNFLTSRIEQTTNKDEVSLRVWEPPTPEGIYAIGVDPSGGGGEDADDHAIQVFRCYADRLVQVAEYQNNQPYTYQLAWVLAHLGGAYRNHIANVEITGIGAAVPIEVDNLRTLAERGILTSESKTDPILNMIGNVRWYLYKRADTYGGRGNVKNWKTNADNKFMIYSLLRDSMMKNELEIRSRHLVEQLQGIVEDEGWLGAGQDTAQNDDLVTAAVLAHYVWADMQRNALIARGMTWKRVHEKPPPPGDIGMTFSVIFSQHVQTINKKATQRKERF